MKKFLRKLHNLLIIFISFLLLSCGKGKNESTIKSGESSLPPVDTIGAVSGDWIIKREMSDAEKLNPVVTNDATAEGIYLLIFESLNDMDYETFEQIPRIASLPEVTPDLMSYTYKINKEAKWSDGKPITGEDVIFTMKAIKNPLADDAALRNYYEKVSRVELVNNDPYTIRIVMNSPYWFAIYSNGDFSIIPKHILDPENLTDKYTWDELKNFKSAEQNPNIKKFADFLNSQEVSREPKYVVGSGPYMLEKWETGQSIRLKKNPNYWKKNETPNYPDKIVFKIIQDNSAAVVAAKNKEIDLMYVVVPQDFYKNLQNSEEFNLKRITPAEPQFTYIGWNHQNPLFADKKVRMALSHLVDRKSLIEKILYGYGVPIQSPIYYKQEKLINKDLPEIPFDPEKAKQLLSEAGWKDTDGDGVLDKIIDGKKKDFKFTFLLNTNPVRQQVILVYSEALKKVGIIADIQQLEWSVYLDRTKKHLFEATMAAWVLGVTPMDPYQIFHSSQMEGEGSNYVCYNNPLSDSLIVAYRNEVDENKRAEIIKKWQAVIYEDQVYTFLWSPNARYVYDTRFRNTRFYARRNSPQLNEWWVPIASQKYKAGMN